MGSDMYQMLEPFAHLLPPPTLHGSLIDREQLVGDDQILADPEHLAEALTLGAGAVGIVEIKHQVGGLAEVDAVGREATGEYMLVGCRAVPHLEHTLSAALEEGRLHRVGQARDLILLIEDREAVDEQSETLGGSIRCDVGHLYKFAVALQARIALLGVDGELLAERAPLRHRQVCEHRHARPLGI